VIRWTTTNTLQAGSSSALPSACLPACVTQPTLARLPSGAPMRVPPLATAGAYTSGVYIGLPGAPGPAPGAAAAYPSAVLAPAQTAALAPTAHAAHLAATTSAAAAASAPKTDEYIEVRTATYTTSARHVIVDPRTTATAELPIVRVAP
jgi:hypothetical protein